jgi:hypothetical protein
VMATAAENAAKFWDSIAEFDLGARLGAPRVKEGLEALERAAWRWEFGDYRDHVLQQARFLFELPVYEDGKMQLPSKEDYAKLREKFVQDVAEAARRDFELKFLDVLRSQAQKKDMGLGFAYGWMLMRNDYLLELLKEYQPATDTESLDFQIFHRLKLATYLLDWAMIAPGWGAIRTLSESVKNARQEGQKQSFLSLRSDWEPSPSALSQLRADFPSEHIIPSWEPLTMKDVVAFFDSEYNHFLALRINRLLQKEQANYDISKPPLLVRAQQDAAKLEMPARYTVTDTDFAILDKDTTDFAELIYQHPKTIAFLKRKRQPGDSFDPLHLAPGRPGEVYLWIFPSFVNLIAEVKDIDEFSRVIYRARLPKGARMPVEPNLDSIKKMPEGPWWDEYRKALKALGAEDKDAIAGGDELTDVLIEGSKSDLKLAEEEVMKASILDRTTRIQQLYRPLMEGYDRYGQFDKLTINTSKGPAKILKYEIPINVLRGAATVAQATGPRRYQQFHQAAFLLELADLLLDKLSVNPRMDVVVGYLPVLDDVLATVKSNPAMLAEILTPAEKTDPLWLAQRTEAISKLDEKMRTITIDEQSRFGFMARKDADGDSILGIGEGYAIKVDDPFTIGALFETGATTWTLKRVAQNFIYHPAFGPAKPRVILIDANGDPQRELNENEKAGQLLLEMEISDGGNDLEGKKKPGVRTKIFAKDADILARLSYAVTMEAIIRQLKDLAAFIEGAMEWTVELVELLPGAGQLAMAAHLVIGIVEFLASPEFKILRDELFDHPGKLISQGIDILSQLFNPMQLWEYLLFASNPFDRLHDVDQEPPQGKLLKQSSSSSIGGRIKAILVSLYHLGKRLLGFTGRLQTKVRWEAEAIQESVIEKPLLAAFLHFVANHIDEIALVVSGALDAYGAVDETQKKIESELEDWPKQVIGLVNTLQQLELPNEIIPMWQVYAIITDLVLSRLGAKFRIAGKAIMWLLAKTGKDQVVFNAVNSAITSVNKNLDLNAIWRGLIKDKLEAPLKSARKEFAVEIFGILAEVPLLSDGTKNKFIGAKSAAASESGEIKPQLVEEDELAAYPLSSPRDLSPVALPREVGAPLPPPDRRWAESRFGHDFAHVRVHQGAEAKRVTREAGAAALTSGSNVYLGSGVSSSSEIFDHELTHVLQQTGPRPLGRPYDGAAVSGRAKTGIRYDPAAESAANRTARQVRSRRSGSPIDPGPSANAGAQPGLLVTITRRFLEEVSQTGGVEHTEEKEDRAHLRQTPDNVQKQVSEVWGTFQSALKSLTAKGPFGDTSKQIPDEIRKYLLSESGDDGGIGAAIKHAVSDLAGDSMDEVKPTKGPKQKNVAYKLNIKRFRVAFERYILGKSGVALSIDFAKLASDDDLAKVTGVTVDYIYLQIVHGGRTLWKKAVEDLPLLNDPKERAKWLPRLRTHLAGLGPSPGIWEKTRYSLKNEVLQKVIDEAGKSKLIDPNDLPPPAQYLAPKGSATGQLGHIGLRVGTYSEKGEGGTQNGAERESHHITQYLLLEYFNNKSSGVPAFPLLKSDVNPYPGLSASSGVVEQFQSGSKPPLLLKKFEDKRGSEMPAILLSRITHRTAGLHVTSKADDFKDENVDSPATAINAIFRENLAAASGPSQADKGLYLDAQKDLASFRKYKAAVGPAKIEDTIYAAMQETYRWMKNYMQPRLKDGLERVEAKYYNALAEEVGKPTITAGELADVWAFAVSHNNKVMSSAGFKD